LFDVYKSSHMVSYQQKTKADITFFN